MSSGFTLSRAEADAVHAHGLIYTDGSALDHDYGTWDGCCAAVRRLQLEATIRVGFGWWGNSPRADEDVCPDSLSVSAECVDAIVELLPEMLADVDRWVASCADPMDRRGKPKSASALKEDAEWLLKSEVRREHLLGLAARLGVEAVTA